MNKYFLSLIGFLALNSFVNAQELSPGDVMRYNESDLSGTARFRGMSGAFGAVGGDLSALKVNPAGSAIFNYNTAALSLSYLNRNNKSNYFGNNNSERYSGLDLGQMGALFVFKSNNPNATMSKFTIGLNYESTKNLRNDMYFSGNSPMNNTGLGDYFLQIANHGGRNGEPIGMNVVDQGNTNHTDGYINAGYQNGYNGQQAYLAYQAGLINPLNNSDGYEKNFDGRSAQARAISTTGYTGQFSGNFAVELNERFYIGTNLNLHVVDYTQNSSSLETFNSQPPTQNNNDLPPVTSAVFNNYLYTYGTGFSFDIGAIAKITDYLRAGLTYHSPTWYTLNDELTQSLNTSFTDGERGGVYPNVVNLYDRYNLRTPSKYTGSLAYIFGERGLISVDYSLQDYSKNEFRPKYDDAYNMLNQSFKNNMKTAGELRIGAEYRIKQISIRGGYRYEESPYKDVKLAGDLNSFSAGIGYDFGGSRLDLSYSYATRSYKRGLLDTSFMDNLTSLANIKTKDNWINLTYNINF
jgi:hypothetical protein